MSIENPSLLYLDQPLTEDQKAVARENIGAQAAEYGKGLSTNDYTLAEKNKLGGIAAGAQVNTIDSISVNGVAQSVEEKNVDITIPVVGIQVGGTDVTPDSNHKVNLEIPSGVQRNGIDLTPDANNKVNVVVPVLGIKLAGSMAVPDSEKVVSIPLAQGPNSGVTTNGLLSSTDKGKIDNMVTTVKMNNTELPKSSGAVNIPLFGGSSNPGVVSSTVSDADKFLKGDGTWGNPTVVHRLNLLEDPTGYPEGYYLCDASSGSQEPITYADFARLYATGTITLVHNSGDVYVINHYTANQFVTFAWNNDGLAFGHKDVETESETVINYVWSADPYTFLGVNGVSANGHDIELDSDGWVNIPLAEGSSPATESSDGLMSGTDKDKLDAYPAVPSSSTGKFLKDDGSWDTPTGTTYSDYAGSTHGLVPPRPSGGTVTKYLREDGQWEVPAGGGGGSVTAGTDLALNNGVMSVDTTGTANGTNAFVEGYATVASGNYSHAEGNTAVASGEGAHAEGCTVTLDAGKASERTRTTTASGNYSHAEGAGTTAQGAYTHAEGCFTTATRDAAHAEGVQTTATGSGAHAGGYGTEVAGYGYFGHGTFLHFTNGTSTYAEQPGDIPVFVCGTLNATQAQDTSVHGGYLMVVGNGTYVSDGTGTRSDAFILHRDGTVKATAFQNASGTETIGGASKSFSGIDNIEVFANGTVDPADFPQDNVLRIILEA